MEKINVLIIESNPEIASEHADYLINKSSFNPVGIASDIKSAKMMIECLNPNLLILENNLPDGDGIDLIKNLASREYTPRIDSIFITSSRDIDTLKKSIEFGCFDYLIKPFTYDRLHDSLDRYVKYRRALEAYDTLTQRQVDIIYNLHLGTENKKHLPKGIDRLTLDNMLSIFNSNVEKRFSADSLAKSIGVSKTTSRRYLEYCRYGGYLRTENEIGQMGRPIRLYYKKNGC